MIASFCAGQPQSKIKVFRFNDAPEQPAREAQSDANRVYPGDSILDLGQMISTLKDAGYEGVISLELFNPSYWKQDPAEVAQIGLEKMQALLES